MADTVKSAQSLNINWQFTDGDTRQLYLNYPDDYDLDELRKNIKSYRDWVVENEILVGDRTGAPLEPSETAIKACYIHYATDTYLDLS